MTRTRWIAAASALALAFVATTAQAGKQPPPPPPPTIVASVWTKLTLNSAVDYGVIAAVSDGRLLVARALGNICYPTTFQQVGNVPAKPASVALDPTTGILVVVLENGDVYQADTVSPTPWTFCLIGNYFSATAASLPDFPSPSFATPMTGDPATTEDDTPEPVGNGAVK